MTIAEMHINFQIGVDKVDSQNYPGFEPEEIDVLLNVATERFVKQRYGGNNIKRSSFEETQKRTDDIRELIENAIIIPNASVTANKANGVFIDLPTSAGAEYWFAINEEVEINYTDCHGKASQKTIEVKAVQHDDYNKIIRDPFNKPYEDQAIRLMYKDKVELIGDGTFTFNRYFLRYIRKPAKVSLSSVVNSDLADHTHQEIVDIAVAIALENIESQRYQTNLNELNKTE